MALLKPALLFNVAKRSFGVSRAVLVGHWNKDWAPGPYPVTEEEKVAAAKKYGLFREEYEPIPDDGDGAGDYPNFKPYSVEGRDPHYPWDYPEHRRNFNEPIHDAFNMYTEDRYNVDMKPRYSLPVMLSMFLGVMGSAFWLVHLGEDACFFPVMPQHMPFSSGAPHYKYPGTSSHH